MLIRFSIENTFSYGPRQELSMIPYKRLGTLKDHLYSLQNGQFHVLKMASLYGANGSGKSNLIKSMRFLQSLVLGESDSPVMHQSPNKLLPESQSQILVVEFIQSGIPFYFGLAVKEGEIQTEELYVSGLGVREDELIYERKSTDTKGEAVLNFGSKLNEDPKSQILREILIQEFLDSRQLIFKMIANREAEFLQPAKLAFLWFKNTLKIISPHSKPVGLTARIDLDPSFRSYTSDFLQSVDVGIKVIKTAKTPLRTYFGEDDQEQVEQLISQLKSSAENHFLLPTQEQDLLIKEEAGRYWVKKLQTEHQGPTEETVTFDLEDESDGTKRLLDFAPVFADISQNNCVYLVDEIERSIHPLLIKSLLRKFSLDPETQGQLIFTTHESTLLDQEVFRQDEIWFVEKNPKGFSELYALSSFREHKTIDIRKGYLSGRYGSVPVLSDLINLNWNSNASKKPKI
ncbi:ATP-binding protein [Pontibacter sp. G13]|uniref:AAA family ATPase n=1 Tax=Pontibacter sp. G13 TaxID=3074898 RepID=UPI0028894EA5|nr:ATP-binding protein [Pontibacter sp. G13]WNJ17681.1 ATP-binding protein [Pontibacter sp. G13]